jgi:hypothetical protein
MLDYIPEILLWPLAGSPQIIASACRRGYSSAHWRNGFEHFKSFKLSFRGGTAGRYIAPPNSLENSIVVAPAATTKFCDEFFLLMTPE